MASQERSRDGVRILSLDSGGPGTYSQALIIEEIEDTLKKLDTVGTSKPSLIRDHFDLIGGVGFGGLLAIMLGRLGMTATQAKDGLLQVAQAVFPPDVVEQVTPEIRSQRLREAIEGITAERRMAVDSALHDKQAAEPACIVVVFVASSNDQQAYALRTYEPRSSLLNPTIVEAACATISVPSFFSPVVVGPPMLRQSFIASPEDHTNPALKLIDQSKALFGPDKKVTALISIGCGQPLHKPQSGPSDPSKEKRRYESTGTGTFLDILSPVQMVRGSIKKKKAKKAQSSNATTGDIALHPDAGFHASNLMAQNCAKTSKEALEYFKGSARYIRLDTEKETTALNFDDWSNLISVHGQTRTYMDQLQPASDIRRLLEIPKPEKRPKSVPKAPPRVTPNFVSRNEAYRTMRHYLVDDRVTYQKIMVITGMGGCGKTQIVSYFLRENESLYAQIIYVDASSEESIKTDLEAWIQSVKGHEEEDWQGALTYIRHGLRNEPWILVLDNADDINVKIGPFIPPCSHGTILITSQSRDRGDLATTAHIELGVMTPEEAMSTLLRSAKRQIPLASEEELASQNLLAELGYLPLAVNLAGSYCHRLSSIETRPYMFSQYLAAFCSKRSRLMDRQQLDPLDQYTQSVNTTISLSYDRMSDSEKEYLDLFATFDGTDISLEIFSVAATKKFNDRGVWMQRPAEHEETLAQLSGLFLVDQEWDVVGVEAAIANLSSNSLLLVTSVSGTMHIHVHPLVQAWACDRRNQDQSSRYTLMAAQVLTACNANENPSLSRAMLSHIQLLQATGKIAGLHINSRMAFVLALRERGYYNLAAEYCSAAYEELEGRFGSEDLVTLEAASMLASIRRGQGQFKEAKRLHLKVWEQRKEKLGADHEDTLISAASLAFAYKDLGRYRDALQLQLEVWEKRKEKLGSDHSGTLFAADSLAQTYGDLGRHKDALQLQIEVWEKLNKKLGEDHPRTLASGGNLAMTYERLHRFQDALQLAQEIWERTKKVLGADHPNTLISANNLALVYVHLGRYQDALQLGLKVWETQKEILGVDHPHTLNSGHNLAKVYSWLNRYEDAGRLQLEVWNKRKEVLGAEHPSTLWSGFNLAVIYTGENKREQAFPIFREVLTLQTTVIGLQHPDTSYMTNLASQLGFDLDSQPA